jgi:hypothetical protein
VQCCNGFTDLRISEYEYVLPFPFPFPFPQNIY